MRVAVALGSDNNGFQSAPGREAGRCVASAVNIHVDYTFQSAPGREAGRCAAEVWIYGDIGVSIRARP